jgi:hypothetical protein
MSDERARIPMDVHPAGQSSAYPRDQEPTAVRAEASEELVSHRCDVGDIDRKKREPDRPAGVADQDPAVDKLASQARRDLLRTGYLAHQRINTLAHPGSLPGRCVRLQYLPHHERAHLFQAVGRVSRRSRNLSASGLHFDGVVVVGQGIGIASPVGYRCLTRSSSGGRVPYIVDFENVSTVGLESSPVAKALAGLRANEARYYKNKYGHVYTVSPAGDAPETLDWLNRILADERDIVISARPLEVTSFEVDGFRMAYVFYESGLSINVMYGIKDGEKRAVGFKLSEGMEVPEELASRFKFARQKSKLAGVIRGSFFVIKGEY